MMPWLAFAFAMAVFFVVGVAATFWTERVPGLVDSPGRPAPGSSYTGAS